MKIAVLGSAPSLPLAPFGDPSWLLYGCSPGVYPLMSRCDAWFELHRWEPGVVGKPQTQKPWFSPEYVAWMAGLTCPVWMHSPVPQIPMSRMLDPKPLTEKYGTWWFTSTIAFMMACAIEDILEWRRVRAESTPEELAEIVAANVALGSAAYQDGPDVIGLWGIDMAATEEYGYQRAGCQRFVEIAQSLGIQVYCPPESDLLRPMPLYGLCESEHWHIKLLLRKNELVGRRQRAEQTAQMAAMEAQFLKGALDDNEYVMSTWAGDRTGTGVSAEVRALDPVVRRLVLASVPEPEISEDAEHPLET